MTPARSVQLRERRRSRSLGCGRGALAPQTMRRLPQQAATPAGRLKASAGTASPLGVAVDLTPPAPFRRRRVVAPAVCRGGPLPPYCGGLISQTVRLNRSPVGAVSLMVTVVPDTATDPFNRCTQYVSPTLDAI